MPFIDAKISKKLSPEDVLTLKTEFGKAIALFPGKSEAWLMCDIAGERDLFFQGNNDAPTAFIEVKLLGGADGFDAERFTEYICRVMEDRIGVPASRVYIRYSGGNLWGWNGGNF